MLHCCANIKSILTEQQQPQQQQKEEEATNCTIALSIHILICFLSCFILKLFMIIFSSHSSFILNCALNLGIPLSVCLQREREREREKEPEAININKRGGGEKKQASSLFYV